MQVQRARKTSAERTDYSIYDRRHSGGAVAGDDDNIRTEKARRVRLYTAMIARGGRISFEALPGSSDE